MHMFKKKCIFSLRIRNTKLSVYTKRYITDADQNFVILMLHNGDLHVDRLNYHVHLEGEISFGIDVCTESHKSPD